MAEGSRRRWVALLVLASASHVHAQAQPSSDAGAAAEQALPAEHVPHVQLEASPKSGTVVGDVVKLSLRADALAGDDVTVPEQSFAPFEVKQKRARVEPVQNGRQRFVFEIDLLALEPGTHALKPLELRVVTKDGFVGKTQTEPLTIKVGSLLANEPNAKLKPETKPVVVMQDDYRLLYALFALVAAGLIALVTYFVSRYLQRRQKPLPPPPPPRPAWEIAIEKLGALRRKKQRMIEEGKAAQFVDEVSDVVREYLGARFGFEGLETTTDEMIALLRSHGASVGLLQEVAAYLARCDLVKFAKLEPDQDEADLVYAKAQDIVQFSMPLSNPQQPGSRPPSSAAPSAQSESGGAP